MYKNYQYNISKDLDILKEKINRAENNKEEILT